MRSRFAFDLIRLVVFTKTNKARCIKVTVRVPFQELKLPNELSPEPARVFHLRCGQALLTQFHFSEESQDAAEGLLSCRAGPCDGTRGVSSSTTSPESVRRRV